MLPVSGALQSKLDSEVKDEFDLDSFMPDPQGFIEASSGREGCFELIYFRIFFCLFIFTFVLALVRVFDRRLHVYLRHCLIAHMNLSSKRSFPRSFRTARRTKTPPESDVWRAFERCTRSAFDCSSLIPICDAALSNHSMHLMLR